MSINNIFPTLLRTATGIIFTVLTLLPSTMSAFDLSTYAPSSVLSSGRWVKIGVEESGLYMIPAGTLREWGFTDPSKVRIHGYGGARIGDVLSQSDYIDDLPMVYSEATRNGVVFYASGPETWTNAYGGHHRETSPYTSWGYYFVTQAETDAPAIAETASPGASEPARTATAHSQHEIDEVQATLYGPLMVGEDLRYPETRTIQIPTPGCTGSITATIQTVTNIKNAGATLSLQASSENNGSQHPIGPTGNGTYVHATVTTMQKSMEIPAAETLSLKMGFTSQGSVGMAYLDFIALEYEIGLEMPEQGALAFYGNRPYSVGGAEGETRIWDVTDPLHIKNVKYTLTSEGRAEWTPSQYTTRSYVAWTPGKRLPAPKAFGPVANQDLHADATTPDMVIFTTSRLTSQARRIASLHEKEDGMTVAIVDAALVYNEFSSGAPDISGLRKYLKMLYDRGAAAGHPLRYALLLGRPTLDHRGLLPSSLASTYATMPSWVVRLARQSINETDGYGTDDFIAMLGDDSGADMGKDELSIAVGRIPMTSADDGEPIVDKLYQYVESSKKTGWKNKMLMLADDRDVGIHVNQTEESVSRMMATPLQQNIVRKVYLDAYTPESGVYPLARRDMFHALDEGVVWWFYIGHANNHSWTADGQLTYTDINSMYLRYIPFVVAATCNFLQWDNQEISGGEIMYKERYGGAIGMISATRPVYITDNGYFLNALGRHTLSRDEQGRMLTAGEVYRRAKNDIRNNKDMHVSNPNRLRFVYMGDPAMRIATPDNIVELSAIDGISVTPDNQVTIQALSNITVTGRVVSPTGELMTDFDGVINIELYDAERSVTTLANGDDGAHVTFDTDGDKLFMGSAPVKEGLFSLNIAMPSMIADNFRPAAMSMYAYATNSNAEAVGTNRDFYIYGFHEPETPDDRDPVIDSMVLNHSGFKSGDVVHPSPMVIAHVSDNLGLNLSNTGIGRQMSLTLDEFTTYNDVSLYYTPDPDGQPGGTINYPFENLGTGPHTLKLRVFDTTGNQATHTIDFTVAEGLTPCIFDVFSDANPASTAANFYVRHDRPESVTTVDVTVYDLMGRPIWTGSSRGMSDMDLSTPVTWDLTDNAGRRVKRGIYLYRAAITADGTVYETASRRIAVTAP